MAHPLKKEDVVSSLQSATQAVLGLNGDYLPEEAIIAGEKYGAIAIYSISPDPTFPGLSQTKGGWKALVMAAGMVLNYTADSYKAARDLGTSLALDLSAAIPDIIDESCLVEKMGVHGYDEPKAIDFSISAIIKNRHSNIHLVTATTEFNIRFAFQTDLTGRPKVI